MHNPWFQLVVAVLAVWRVAHLVVHEDGPFDVIVSMRRHVGSGGFGRLMDCPYCLTLWAAALPAWWIADEFTSGILLWLAISGGACVLERSVFSRNSASTAVDIAPLALGAEAANSEEVFSSDTGAPHAPH
jgi:hypothetical protein